MRAKSEGNYSCIFERMRENHLNQKFTAENRQRVFFYDTK